MTPDSTTTHQNDIASPTAEVVRDEVVWRHLRSPAVAVTSAGVYLAWRISPLGRGIATDELARLSARRDRIVTRRGLPGTIDSAVVANDSLWITVARGSQWWLWRLDPTTLAAQSHRRVVGPSLAVTGNGLWLAGGSRLERLSLPVGRLTKTVRLPQTADVTVASSADGKVLLDSKATAGGTGRIERRDPRTGRLLATSSSVIGATAPFVTAVTHGSFWLSESTGMMGYARPYRLAGLTPLGNCTEGEDSGGCIEGTNAIDARSADGRIWISQPAGGRSHNLCVDPRTYRPLTHFTLSASQSLLAIDARWLYVESLGQHDWSTVTLRPIPAACAAP